MSKYDDIPDITRLSFEKEHQDWNMDVLKQRKRMVESLSTVKRHTFIAPIPKPKILFTGNYNTRTSHRVKNYIHTKTYIRAVIDKKWPGRVLDVNREINKFMFRKTATHRYYKLKFYTKSRQRSSGRSFK